MEHEQLLRGAECSFLRYGMGKLPPHVGTVVVVKDVALASGKVTKATKDYA